MRRLIRREERAFSLDTPRTRVEAAAMADRPDLFRRPRELPVVGRAADWGLGPSAVSKNTKRAGSRIAGLKATESVCPYCAVGCGQIVYTREGELVDIEGNPRSPTNQGALCPKGAASRQLIQQSGRLSKVKYRRPGGTEWEGLELETAMDMIAERMIAAREDHCAHRREELLDEVVLLVVQRGAPQVGKGLIRHIIETENFEEYVVHYTNVATIVNDRFQRPEDLDGVFSGFDAETGTYDRSSWMYEGGEVAAPAGVREHATQASPTAPGWA